MLLILIILLLVFGLGGGYRVYGNGYGDPIGIIMLVLVILIVLSLFGSLGHLRY